MSLLSILPPTRTLKSFHKFRPRPGWVYKESKASRIFYFPFPEKLRSEPAFRCKKTNIIIKIDFFQWSQGVIQIKTNSKTVLRSFGVVFVKRS